MELQKVETPTVTMSGFAVRNANKERIEKEEEELRSLEEENKAPKAKAAEDEGSEDDSSLSAEEKSFKKRYGDLRRHTQKQQVELQKQIDALQEQLQASTSKQIRLPTSEDELEQWAKEFPDVAKIVESIAIKKAKEQNATLEERFKKLDEREAQTAKERAEAELLRLHPDFDQIREQEEFHDWAEAQPKWVQSALYDNENDAISAARAIDLYKADMGITTKKPRKSQEKDAAREVAGSKRAGFDASNEAGVIRESDVERMSAAEYERNQEAIIAAVKSGKFIYDKSGSAR